MSEYVVAGLLGALVGGILALGLLVAWFAVRWRWL
jgi:hypothetical protein